MPRCHILTLLLLVGCSTGSVEVADSPPAETTDPPAACIIPPRERMVCTQQYEPVCGCDGRTYGNACSARAAGVQRIDPGECGDPNRGQPVDS